MSNVVVRLHRCVSSSIFDIELLHQLRADKGAVQECEVLDFKQQLGELCGALKDECPRVT